jgi:pSer/pThr/pTyr-binding forkhead associated (FHA) protein
MTPSVIREEEKENSSQSDDIFYTCPQIDESTRKVGLAFSYHVIYEIEDFSTNGTFLNGERLEKNKRIPLKDGD